MLTRRPDEMRFRQPRHLSRFRNRIAIFMSSVLWLSSVGWCDEERPPLKLPDDVQKEVQNIKAARAELRSGIFHAVGRVTQGKHPAEPVDSKLYCAFDSKSSDFRFDTRGHRFASVTSAEKGAIQLRDKSKRPAASKRKVVSLFTRNSAYMVAWLAIGESTEEPDHATSPLVLRDPKSAPELPFSAAFLPEAVGLFELRGIPGPLQPNELRPGQAVEDLFNRFAADSTSVSLRMEDDNTILIEFVSASRTKRTVTIDSSRGHTVRRMEMVYFSETGEVMKSPKIEASATWEQQDSVWVPVQFTTSRINKNNSLELHEYDLQWEAVNPDMIDPKLFTYESFDGVWKGTDIFEHREGKKQGYIDTIGGENLRKQGLIADPGT